MGDTNAWTDAVGSITGGISSIIYAARGQQPPVIVREPAVSVGLTGQSGWLLLGVVALVAIYVWKK